MGVWSDALTGILIPSASLIGIGFALLQWFLVSRVKVSKHDEYHDSLVDNEEEGVDGFESVIKCSEIQSAISVGKKALCLYSLVLWYVGLVSMVTR